MRRALSIGRPGPLIGMLALALVACAPPEPEAPKVEELIRAQAASWWGTPYKWGGTTKAGIDCSAFTQTIYASTFGLKLPRTAEQQERLGLTVPKDSLKAGDLVFFRTGGFLFLFRRRHVGVYLSNGEFAHASGSKGVTTSRLDEPFWRKEFKTARRVLAREGSQWAIATPPPKQKTVAAKKKQGAQTASVE
jgi:probable lipoprotein NlpC